MSECATKMKYSRFRHVFAKSVRRSEWYDTGAGRGFAVAANPKMIALAVDVPAGGIVQVAKLCTMGKGHMEMGKIKDHEGAVCDVKWNPFNDNVLATGSHDATVRVWHIDDILRIRCLRILRAHQRRVQFVEWHPLVDNAIVSAGSDGRIVMWNVETDEVIYTVDDCHATSLSFSRTCGEFAVTTRSHELVVFDARSGARLRSAALVHDGSMPPRVVWSYGEQGEGGSERIITTGSSRNTRRQLAVYDTSHIDSPLAVIDVDGASGLLMPIIDNDLNLLYVAGKGDANIRFYELCAEAPFLNYLGESSGNRAHTAVGSLPKRGLSVSQCEIMRIFRLDAEQLVVEPLSFIVPRRDERFQADLFPPTRSPTPALLFREWLAGLDRAPILISLRDCVLNCTNKPVGFVPSRDVAHRPPKLVTADFNNDRKFQFLSQVTRPDYREVNDREDRDELLKVEKVKAKLAAQAAANDLLSEHGFHCVEDERGIQDEKCSDQPSIVVSAEVAALNHKNSSVKNISNPGHIFKNENLPAEPATNGHSLPPKKEEQSPAPSLESGIEFHVEPVVRRSPQQPQRASSYVHGKDEKIGEWGDANPRLTKFSSARSCCSEEALVSVIREMEKELCKCRGRCDQLEKVVRVQQEDIDSLRFEIHWKDDRIQFLQSQLTELETARSNSSRSS